MTEKKNNPANVIKSIDLTENIGINDIHNALGFNNTSPDLPSFNRDESYAGYTQEEIELAKKRKIPQTLVEAEKEVESALGLDESPDLINPLEHPLLQKAKQQALQERELNQEPTKEPNRKSKRKRKRNNNQQPNKKLEASPEPTQYNVSSETIKNTRKKLEDIAIDVNNIQIVERNEQQKAELINFNLNGKPTYQIIAFQSGYTAHMEALNLNDVNSIANSTSDGFSTKNRLYKTVYNKLNTSTIGKPDYETWLKITSFYDLPTFLYGIYQQSFPTDTKFEVTCRHCENKSDVIINNETLISTKDDEVYSKMDELYKSASTPEKVYDHSLVNKFTRKVLPKSKILIDIQTPSLHDHINVISKIGKEISKEFEELAGTLLFVKNLYMPDIVTFEQTGELKYFPVDNINTVMEILLDLDIEDASELGNEIAERTNKYAINYEIRSFNCGMCGKELGNIPVDMEELVFTRILQM